MDQDSAIDFILGRGEGVAVDPTGFDVDGGRGALDRYFLELERHPTLDDKGEQLALARRIRDAEADGQTDEARELEIQFLLGQLRIGVSIAGRSHRKGVELEDRIQEGNIGLIRAAKEFNPERGCTFFTFAKWGVRRAIQRGAEDTGRTIRLPSHVNEDLRRIAEVVRQHERKFGKTPTAEQIAEAIGISVKKVNKLLEVRGQEALTILDKIEPGESESLLHKSLGADRTTPEDLAVERDIARKLSAAVDRLSERQATVIRSFYGLETGVPLNLEEIANEIGLHCNTVRMCRDKALEILRGMEEVGDLRCAI